MAKPISRTEASPRPSKKRRAAPNPAAFFTQKQADAMLAAESAATVANPAEVRRAMLSTPRQIKGVTVRVVTLEDYLFLEELKSPLLEGAQTPTFYDLAAAAFVLASPPLPTAAKWREGEPAFRAAVRAWAGRHFTPADLAELTSAVTASLYIGFDPAGDDIQTPPDADPLKKKPRSPTGGR